MSTLTSHPAAPTTRTPRDLRRARRLAAAVLLPIAPLSVGVLRLIWPGFSAGDTAASLDAAAAHPAAQQTVVWLGMLMTLTMVPAVLAAARLARRRRPMLAMLAAGINLAAYLGGTTVTTTDLQTLIAARGTTAPRSCPTWTRSTPTPPPASASGCSSPATSSG